MVKLSKCVLWGVALVSLTACAEPGPQDGEEDDLPPAAQVSAPDAGAVSLLGTARVGAGSGVWVGERSMLTNWHVCTDAPALRLHNDPGGGAPPFREGAACRARRDESCNPPTSIRFDGAGQRAATGQAVFMSRAIDVCIVELRAEASVPVAAEPVVIETTPVRVGQAVVVSGYPAGSARRVTEQCKVTAGIALVRDPDRVNPSDLSVPSFAVDCKTVKHGSSGGPVFDAETGALLGLVWTGVCNVQGRSGVCEGPFYVTAASEWRKAHAARPVAEYTRLDALLETFSAP